MSLQTLADQMKSRGRNGDSELVHMTKGEVAGLQQLAMAAGGSLTINPDTGLPEASFLKSLLPAILGAGAMMIPGVGPLAAAGLVGGLETVRTGDIGRGALAGLGAFGGAGLAGSLTSAGAAGAQQAAMSGLTDTGARNLAAAEATKQFAAQPLMSQAGQGITALGGEAGRSAALQGLGGAGGALKTAGMAGAPLIMDAMTPRGTGSSGISREGEDTEDLMGRYEFQANPTGGVRAPGAGATSEARYFDPQFRRRMAMGGQVYADGGIMSLAKGGSLNLDDGDFIISSDVTSFVGGGSTDAGQRKLAKAVGAIPIKGPGDGLSDDIPATIAGKAPARVADGEMLVKQPGKAGTKKLYAMMDNVRKQATGSKKQIKPVNLKKALA